MGKNIPKKEASLFESKTIFFALVSMKSITCFYVNVYKGHFKININTIINIIAKLYEQPRIKRFQNQDK